MKRVGIIGGMGPAATIDLYQKIIAHTQATCDQEHLPLLIDNYPQIEDRTTFIQGKGASPAPKLIESAQRLEQGGAQALMLACNTAHYFVPDILPYINIPIIHIAEEAVKTLAKKYPQAKKIAVIATQGTLTSGVYQEQLAKFGLEQQELCLSQQESIMRAIYQGVKAGRTEDFIEEFNDTLLEINADIYIAACTEIPLFFPYIDLERFTFIDATDELAQAAVKFALS